MRTESQHLTFMAIATILLVAAFSLPADAGYYTWIPAPHGDNSVPPFPISVGYGASQNITITVHDRDTWNNQISDPQENDEVTTIHMYATKGPGHPKQLVQTVTGTALSRREEMGYVFFDATFTLGPPHTQHPEYKYLQFRVKDAGMSQGGTPMADDPSSHEYLPDTLGGFFPITIGGQCPCVDIELPCAGQSVQVCETAPATWQYTAGPGV